MMTLSFSYAHFVRAEQDKCNQRKEWLDLGEMYYNTHANGFAQDTVTMVDGYTEFHLRQH